MEKQIIGEWTPPLDKGQVTTTAIAIFCPDSDAGEFGLWQPIMALLQGLLEDPRRERIFPISVAGGPAPLAHPEALQHDSLAVIKHIDDVLAVKRRVRIIFAVMHGGGKGCGYCNEKIRGKLPGCPVENQMQERDDLDPIKQILIGSFPGFNVRTIYVWTNRITNLLEWEEPY